MAFVDICRLRQGPQTLPNSYVLLVLSVCGYTLSSVLLATIALPVPDALLWGAVDTALLIALFLTLLWRFALINRSLQTLSALCGTGMLFSLVATPLTLWLHYNSQHHLDTGIPWLLMLSLLGWNIGVIAHILRHALSTKFVLGLLLAVVYLIVATVILNNLFPAEI